MNAITTDSFRGLARGLEASAVSGRTILHVGRAIRHRLLHRGALRLPILVAAIFCTWASSSESQNHTPGDGWGMDHTAFVYAPFMFQAVRGEGDYFDHVCTQPNWLSGQRYEENSSFVEWWNPDPSPYDCTLDRFIRILRDSTESLGTLLITTHGCYDEIEVEAYAYTDGGEQCRDGNYGFYLSMGFDTTEIRRSTTTGPYYAIGVTAKFIREYGNLSQALVYIASCQSYYLCDDFVTAGARIAVGNNDSPNPETEKSRVATFFSRMDGKEGQGNRAVWAARMGLNNLGTAGNQSTTLAPSVSSVTGPDTLRTGDYFDINLDTKCDISYPPWITCAYGELSDIEWFDSTTIRAWYNAPGLVGVDEDEFTLDYCVKSARNDSYLDGNTDPPGGSNAEGPANDDYEWTMAVSSCYCGRTTTPKMWADVSNDNAIDPQDVNRMVSYVYRSQTTAIIAPPGATYPNAPLPPTPPFTCQYRLGDVNRDGAVGPPDLIRYVNFVFKGQTEAILDNPCGP